MGIVSFNVVFFVVRAVTREPQQPGVLDTFLAVRNLRAFGDILTVVSVVGIPRSREIIPRYALRTGTRSRRAVLIFRVVVRGIGAVVLISTDRALKAEVAREAVVAQRLAGGARELKNRAHKEQRRDKFI